MGYLSARDHFGTAAFMANVGINRSAVGEYLRTDDFRTPQGLRKWTEVLSIPDAPVRVAGLTSALRFFNGQMPTLPALDAYDFIAAMDLSKPVNDHCVIVKHEYLIAARTWDEQPYKLFYTRPGRSMHASGIDTSNRHTVKFKVLFDTKVLESYTASTIDVWTPKPAGTPLSTAVRAPLKGRLPMGGTMVAGGNVQLIIPNAREVLRKV